MIGSITHNLMAMNSGRMLGITGRSKAKSVEKLSSGYRINRAADDAAGLSISEKMRYQIRGLRQGAENTQDGISWCQIGDGAMNEIDDIINRMMELAVKGATGTLSDDDRSYIDQEIQQLKSEINRIHSATTFNEIPIFLNPAFSMDVEGCPGDLEVFDATYDDATGEVTFGGILFHGNRIPWDKINPDMVYLDDNNHQIFKGGTYTYTDTQGRHFEILCEDGDRVPIIRRTLKIEADDLGVTIDGELISWDQLKDENGEACKPGNIHGGSWFLNYHGAELGMYFGEEMTSYDDLAVQINSASDGKFTYTWQEGYIGQVYEQAVDADIEKRTQVTEALSEKLKDPESYQWHMKADETGIWMEDDKGEITGSRKTWAEMQIHSWDEGPDIREGKQYLYEMKNGEFEFSFEFTLSDITSVDSVIDGINDMLVDIIGVDNSYSMDVTASDSNIKKVQARVRGLNITYEDEIALDRDFDKKEVEVASEKATYSADSRKAELTYSDQAGNDVLKFEGDVTAMEEGMKSLVDRYLEYVLRQKMAAVLAGKDPENFQLQSLEDLVGKDNITTSGYFDDVVELNGGMTLTKGTGTKSPGAPGEVGEKYPRAYIDFANIKDLDLLCELGFNSTCKTCDNHYSVVFRNGDYDKVTSSGYRYRMSRQGNNYMLEIDIESLKARGIVDGEGLAKALVEITDAAYDFHYTQYASEGSKLYIYDNRSQSEGTKAATFDTKPYPPIDEGDFHLSMKSDDGAVIDVDYTYEFKDAANRVQVKMNENPDGEYVKKADGSYEKWDGVDSTAVRYSMEIIYRDENGKIFTDSNDSEGKRVSAKQKATEDYAQDAVRDMVTNTTGKLEATDYTYLNLKGDENVNRAVRPLFESEIVVTSPETGIQIKHSSNQGDLTIIPRFPVNTFALGLSRAGTKTKEQAEKTISYIRKASKYVSAKRALYGARQNRLEHTYNNNQNVTENLEVADSRIRDTDMAKEFVRNANFNILQQAGVSMLTQANQQTDYLLALLQ